MGRTRKRPPAEHPPTPEGMVRCPFTVICDTREQSPYTFPRIPDDHAGVDIESDPYEFRGLRNDAGSGGGKILDVPIERKGLPRGDYAILGFPGLVIERKSKSDLFGSVARRANFRGRLEAITALDRVGFVIVEATEEEVATDPPPFSKLHPKSLLRTVYAWQLRYPLVHWVFCKDRQWAERRTFRLLERWYLDHSARPSRSPLK